MSDKPIVGRYGQRPELPPPEDGVVLFDPTPKEPIGDEEEQEERSPWLRFVVAATVLLAVGGAGVYVTLGGLSGGGAGADPVPTFLPAPVGGPAGALVLSPYPFAEVVGQVGDTVRVGVRATGPDGGPMADSTVTFRVERGDAQLLASEAVTDSAGFAVVPLVLPAQLSTSFVVAEAEGLSPSGPITAIATAGAPTRLVRVSGSGQSATQGELLPERVTVQVMDERGHPVPHVPVLFDVRSGDGITAPSRAQTDSLGMASALWRVGLVDDPQSLVAHSPLFEGEILFTATATPPAETITIDRSTGIEASAVTVRPTTYTIGGSHICRLSGSGARCRGANDRGQASSQTGLGFVSLTSGVSHTCGIDGGGNAFCWGANGSGQLGDGTTGDAATPVPVRTELRFSMLVAGAAHTCGLAGGGVPACWGQNVSGQLGDGSRNTQPGPRAVGSGLSFALITAGWNHTCGLTSSGNAFCWGLNSQGQLGDGSRLDRLVPSLVRSGVSSLVAGSAHTCGVIDGAAMCWGGNASGQLGDGTTEDRSRPVAVVDLPSPPTLVVAGAVHTCALVGGGQAYCWGQNLQGQLGDGTTTNRARPVAVGGAHRFRSLHAGGAMTCGITDGGDELCWGFNGSGQLGDGTRTNRALPTTVPGAP